MNCQHPGCKANATHETTIIDAGNDYRIEQTCAGHVHRDHARVETIAGDTSATIGTRDPGAIRRAGSIRLLIEIRRSALADLASPAGPRVGSVRHRDMVEHVASCNRTLARLGHID